MDTYRECLHVFMEWYFKVTMKQNGRKLYMTNYILLMKKLIRWRASVPGEWPGQC